MDYDKSEIATVYDEARGFSPEGLQRWLDLLSRDVGLVPGALVVDLGCGTGRFSEPLAEHFDARVRRARHVSCTPGYLMKLLRRRILLPCAKGHDRFERMCQFLNCNPEERE